MKIKEIFTKNKSLNDLCFVSIPYEMKDKKGFVIFSHDSIEVPQSWSSLAVDSVVSKCFFLKKRIPAKLKQVPEEGIPQWLQRSIPDTEELNKLPKEEQYVVETSVKNLFNRIVGAWTYWNVKNKTLTEEEAHIFYNETFYMLFNQIALPSSIQLVNTGLYWAYGIDINVHDYYHFDSETEQVFSSPYSGKKGQFPCFIQSVDDNLFSANGIMNLLNNEAKLFKYNTGSGTNFSKIRSKNEKTGYGNYSNGVMNFLNLSDSIASAIKFDQNYTASSKIDILNDDHPEILDFINWKVKEEHNLVSMITGSQLTSKILKYISDACASFEGSDKNRYSPEKNASLKNALFLAQSAMIPSKFIKRTLSMAQQEKKYFNFQAIGLSSDTYNGITGQNSSLSVRLSDKFFNKIQNNEDWELVQITDKEIAKTIPAQELLNQISYAAWMCSDPSIQFNDTINNWNTCPSDGKINSSSVSEDYMFLDDTAAAFASLNLLKFRTEEGTFNLEKFKQAIKLLMLAQNTAFSIALYPTVISAQQNNKYNPIAIGYCNLGAYIMSIGLPYDTPEARAIASAITALLTSYAYEVSAYIASKIGVFTQYNNNKDKIHELFINYQKISQNKSWDEKSPVQNYLFDQKLCTDNNLAQEAISSWENTIQAVKKYGLRNAQISALSTYRNVSLIMDCDTISWYPDTSIIKYRKSADNHYVKTVSEPALLALEKLGYSLDSIAEITAHLTGSHTLKNSPFINHKTLKEKGFTKDILEKIEPLLKDVFNIDFLFNYYILGKEFCTEVLKLDLSDFDNPNVSLLEKIGFSRKEIEEANKYIVGDENISNCKLIKEAHVNIFACLKTFNTNTLKNISHEGQIKMASAIQSFITSAVSTVVILPEDSHINEFNEAYQLAWKMGLKTIKLYRAGYKLSQILQTPLIHDEKLDKIDLFDEINNKLIPSLAISDK